MSDQGPPPSGADPAAARPSRPVKKVAKKRPAGSKAPSGSSRPAKKRASSGGSTPPPPINDAQATTRGAIVIAVTVIIGLLVFWQGFSKDTSEIVASGPETTAVPGGPDRDAAPTTTQPEQGTTIPSTPITRVPPDEVAVIVANSVDPSQTIAGPKAATLVAAGYPQPVTMDLAPYGVTTSSVYFTEGFEAEAQAVAVALGLPASSVAAIDPPAPTPMNNAQILVVIGQDGA